MKTTVQTWHHIRTARDLITMADELRDMLDALMLDPEDVFLDTGNNSGETWARLASRKLTDGSEVHDLVVP